MTAKTRGAQRAILAPVEGIAAETRSMQRAILAPTSLGLRRMAAREFGGASHRLGTPLRTPNRRMRTMSQSLFLRATAGEDWPFPTPRALLVFAHPDDEV